MNPTLILTQEEIIGLRWETAVFEQPEQIVELPVDVA
jgi:hypothetical protein